MFKNILFITCITMLSACSISSSVSSYVPFLNDKKTVIDLDEEQIDQKSYATAYEATIQTYKGRVAKDYHVDSFASGVNDWYLNRILIPIDDVKQNLYKGSHDSNIYDYYSGVVFAYELQENFHKLNKDCWSKLDKPSITQGIYDAMLGLRNNDIRSENDEYLVKGSEQVLRMCTK